MRNALPPLNALKSFEATARHGSISKAAQELFVTQSAVSKQIKQLESSLGLALFIRKGQGVVLSEPGEQYLPVVSAALDSLNSASEALRKNPDQQRLKLDITPSFSNIWLIPRLHSFEQQQGNIRVELEIGDGQPDFSDTQADLAIRCLAEPPSSGGFGQLCQERLVLVASPALLARQPLDYPEQLLQQRLLVQTTRQRMWDSFLAELGVDYHSAQHGMGFQHFFMSLRAAQEGLGVALIPDFLAADSLARGYLVNPLGLSQQSDFSYYWLSPGYKLQLAKVEMFQHWLAEQFSSNNKK